MKHNWIFYKNKDDHMDEKSYYCSNCNMKIFTWTVETLDGPELETSIDDNVNFSYDDFSCEEYLIKQIIE